MRKITMASVISRLVETPGPLDTPCYIWTGMLDVHGYGRVGFQGDQYPVHRLMYQYFIGPVPTKLTCDHLCRVRACANPAHIEVITRAANILRGEGAPAQNARKTHCLNGHELVPENLVRTSDTRERRCKICERVRGRAAYWRARGVEIG